MLRGLTIIHDATTGGTQLISTGYDSNSLEGLEFTSNVLRSMLTATEKRFFRVQVEAELAAVEEKEEEGEEDVE